MKSLGIFLSGLAAGAVAGILLAPDKGTVTREKLCERVRGVLRRKGLLTAEEVETVVEAVAALEAEAEAEAKEAKKEHHSAKK